MAFRWVWVQCESNLLGIANVSGTSVGSGGWNNIVEKYIKAKIYCDHPFETRHEGGKKNCRTDQG